MEYFIEQMDTAGHWFILGSRRCSSEAQDDFRRYRSYFPRAALRVTENPSRKIVVLFDGRGED